MAFWGVEVKPGRPFTHKFDDSKGRLHISMATLGMGKATMKSILQCNIGSRSPVYLCSLIPGSNESLQLNLEFEEVDEVIFSVIGPRSVHLCGYFLGFGRNTNLNEESESYGEDIRDTETERSNCSDEDEYEDSFIDDDEPEVIPPSPISNEEEASYDNRPKVKEGKHQRLRKKYQSIESDEGSSEGKIILDSNVQDQTKQFEDEDSLPISSLYKSKGNGRVLNQETDDCDERGESDASNKNGEDGGNSIIKSDLKAKIAPLYNQPHRESEPLLDNSTAKACSVQDMSNAQKLKKKKRDKEAKIFQANSACNDNSFKLDCLKDGPTMDKTVQDLPISNGWSQEQTNDKETETIDKLLPSSEVCHEQVQKPKKKRKERLKDRINSVASVFYNTDIIEKDEAHHEEVKADSNLIIGQLQGDQQNQKITDVELLDSVALASTEMGHRRTKRKKVEQLNKDSNFEGDNVCCKSFNIIKEYKTQEREIDPNDVIDLSPERKEKNQKLTNDNDVENVAHDFPDKIQSEDRKVKKRKKKSHGNMEAVNSDEPQVLVKQNVRPLKEDGKEMTDTKLSQVETLSNGVNIQDLEMGLEDGKVAATGRKISVCYTGKLKESGEVFESNVGHGPLKFRLGKGQVMEGWEVGLEGMRVGGKRRITIPPSIGFGSEGHGENVPPNSWLVYDIELVKVH